MQLRYSYLLELKLLYFLKVFCLESPLELSNNIILQIKQYCINKHPIPYIIFSLY